MKFIVYLTAAVLAPASLWAQDAATAASPAAEPASAAGAQAVTLLRLVISGGWAMLPLAFLSVLTVMLIIVYTFTLRRGAIVNAHFMSTADVLLKKRDYIGLLAISARHSEAVARVLQRTLDFLTKNPGVDFNVVREIAETEGSTQAASLNQRIAYLADIGMLSPMIGLLGTVFGIIRSFGVLAKNTDAPRQMLLAAGVSEALVATASGLVVGITAMAFYAIFRGRVQSLISDLEIASTHLLGMIANTYTATTRRREQAARVTVDDDF